MEKRKEKGKEKKGRNKRGRRIREIKDKIYKCVKYLTIEVKRTESNGIS